MLYRHHILSVVGRANAATLPTRVGDRDTTAVTIRKLSRQAEVINVASEKAAWMGLKAGDAMASGTAGQALAAV
jgi:hypothetical protein